MINKKFQHKHSFLLRDVIIAALFGVGVIALFVLLAGGMASNYNRNDLVSSDFSQKYGDLNRLTQGVEGQRNAVTNSSSGISLLGTLSVTFNSFFTVVSLVWDSIDIFGNVAANAVSDWTFLSPSVIRILFLFIIAALVSYVVFIVISSVTRGRV